MNFHMLEANQSSSSCSCSTYPDIYSPETYTLDWMLVKQFLCLHILINVHDPPWNPNLLLHLILGWKILDCKLCFDRRSIFMWTTYPKKEELCSIHLSGLDILMRLNGNNGKFLKPFNISSKKDTHEGISKITIKWRLSWTL